MQSSPDNANLEFSAIRMRMTINRVQCLLRPLRSSLHFGTYAGCAIEYPNHIRPKGNLQLQVALHNINEEFNKALNALLRVLKNYRLRDMRPTSDFIRLKLRKELNRDEVKTKYIFNDFLTFIE